MRSNFGDLGEVAYHLKCKVATCPNQNADMEHQLPCQQKY